MDQTSIFKKLDSPISSSEAKALLLTYFADQLTIQRSSPQLSEQIAYNMAGLLSTQFVQSLPENDPYLEILHTAGNLELPKQHRGSASWDRLTELIEALET